MAKKFSKRKLKEIDCCIFVTQTPDYLPNNACIAADILGLRKTFQPLTLTWVALDIYMLCQWQALLLKHLYSRMFLSYAVRLIQNS